MPHNHEDEAKAVKEMETILDENRPKHLGAGLLSGAGSILGGGIGAVGLLLLTPVHNAKEGMRNSGVLGGAMGAVGGVVEGAVGAVNVAAGGELFCHDCRCFCRPEIENCGEQRRNIAASVR